MCPFARLELLRRFVIPVVFVVPQPKAVVEDDVRLQLAYDLDQICAVPRGVIFAVEGLPKSFFQPSRDG
jgi:hypothetical protein